MFTKCLKSHNSEMAELKKKKDNRKCGVCADHALGSNFNAITCESCKAFFRRNALKTKEFKCPFENCCKVDVVTRRFCQKCRLKKCFDIGMRKDWIMSEEEKKAKRVKIEKNRRKRTSQQVVSSDEYTSSVKVENTDDTFMLPSPISSMSPMTPQTPGSIGVVPEIPKTQMFAHQPLTPSDSEYSPAAKMLHFDEMSDVTVQDDAMSNQAALQHENSFGKHFNDMSSHFLLNDGKSESSQDETESRCSSVASLVQATCSKQSSDALMNHATLEQGMGSKSSDAFTNRAIKSENLQAIPQSVYAKAVEIEFVEVPIRTVSDSNSRELTSLEKHKMDELIVANEVLKMPLECGVDDPSLLDVINMTDYAIRRLIKMSKKINSFKSLCQDDQIALLKGGCTELMILRSVMSYDPEKDCWHGPQGSSRTMSIKVDILKEAKANVYEEHKRFINSFHPNWRGDENIMLILSAIALFTPERPNTVHREAIKLEQDTYYYLLRRYLDSVYSWCEARATYLKLIHKIQELHNLNENHVRVYLEFNPKDVEPLLIEIFDLKH